MTEIKFIKAKIASYGLVRDKNGVPKIDGDPHKLPKPIKEMLTEDEYSCACSEFREKQNGNS